MGSSDSEGTEEIEEVETIASVISFYFNDFMKDYIKFEVEMWSILEELYIWLYIFEFEESSKNIQGWKKKIKILDNRTQILWLKLKSSFEIDTHLNSQRKIRKEKKNLNNLFYLLDNQSWMANEKRRF